jgi:sugar lactone lactonase YvrE
MRIDIKDGPRIAAVGLAVAVSIVSSVGWAEINAPGYKVEQLVKPSAFHGVHGLAFDAADHLYAGSVVGRSVYRVDTQTGAVATVVGPPQGMADDLVFLPDGTLVWTSINQNAVRARQGDGPVRTLAANLASVNSINYRKSDGRLFVAQVFGGDGLWELDVEGNKPPRNILRDIGGLNGFDIGPDGWIYGPLWFKKQVVRINPDTGELQVVADGFQTPAAANFDSKWNLYVLDTALGTVNRVDIKTGSKSVVAQLATSLDNLAIDSRDRMFVSNMADNGIEEVNIRNGTSRQVVRGALAIPLSLAAVADGKQDLVYVADVFAYRSVHGSSGRVDDLQRAHAAGAQINYPLGVSANERFVALSNANGTLQIYARAGNKLVREITGLRGLQNAIELRDGSLLVAQSSGSAGGVLTRIAKDSDTRTVVISGLKSPLGLALAETGDVYVSDVADGTIARIELNKGTRQVIAAGLKSPQALSTDRDGTLLTVELAERRLVRIDPRNGRVTPVATGLPVGMLGPGSETMPIGVSVGPSGAIYVTSDIENSIYKLSR